MSNSVVVAGDRPIREVNKEIKAELAKGNFVTVKDTRSRHNLGVGLPPKAKIKFEGSVGYYCGGLNDGAFIEVERNAGWSTGEAMATGEIIVNGYAEKLFILLQVGKNQLPILFFKRNDFPSV